MDDILTAIKRAVLARRFEFSAKAAYEMEADGLTELDVAESIMSAVAVYKTVRSRSPYRKQSREYLHIIVGQNFHGLPIYTKGKLVARRGNDEYYYFVSSKLSVFGG
jgi:hypothetical protein